MTSASLAMAWLQLLALLAAEVGLIALGVELLRHWSLAASWRRTFCQAGITAVLVVTVCELSGSARALGGWAASTLAWRKSDNLRTPEAYAVIKVGQGINTRRPAPLFRSPGSGARTQPDCFWAHLAHGGTAARFCHAIRSRQTGGDART
jgi:hypothetical protein